MPDGTDRELAVKGELLDLGSPAKGDNPIGEDFGEIEDKYKKLMGTTNEPAHKRIYLFEKLDPNTYFKKK
jgi:hypothetical protein